MKKMKITIKKVTRAKIEKYLSKIGWSLRHHGCETYMLYNEYGKLTGLCVHGEYDLRNEFDKGDALFGGAKEGYIRSGQLDFLLADINMEYQAGLGYDMLSFFPKGNDKCFISLYDTRDKKP